MRQDAEKDGKAQWASANDSRVTRVGAFIRNTRLDELPQIYNVIRGDMSIVGPRPERPEFVSELREKIPYYDTRHYVQPGLMRSEEHTSELQSRPHLVCRLLLEKKK